MRSAPVGGRPLSEHAREGTSAAPGRSGGRAAGIWIDDREAVIISLDATGATARIVKNETDFPRGEPTRYLDKVISGIGRAERIIAFGPGRTNVDLWKRLTRKKPAIICQCLTTRPMSKNQKVAWVKRYFAA